MPNKNNISLAQAEILDDEMIEINSNTDTTTPSASVSVKNNGDSIQKLINDENVKFVDDDENNTSTTSSIELNKQTTSSSASTATMSTSSIKLDEFSQAFMTSSSSQSISIDCGNSSVKRKASSSNVNQGSQGVHLKK